MNSLAIKLDVSDENQKALNALLLKMGVEPQRRRFHCTVGFMEKCFESPSEAEECVNLLQGRLQLAEPLPFGILEVRFLFRHVVALVPNEKTLKRLREINGYVSDHVNALASGNFALNSQTTEDGFHPHITLWRQRHKDKRFRQTLKEVGGGKKLNLDLVRYSYTIL